MPCLAEISSVVLYFCDFVSMSFWKRARHFIWRNMTLFIQGSSVQILVEISPVVLERRILKVSQCIAIFCYMYYLPLKKVCLFVSSNLNFLYFTVICVKFSFNWLSGSGEDKYWKVLTDGRMTEDRWSEKLTWAFSSGELKQTISQIVLVSIILKTEVPFLF